jgi:hypothetical protein
LPSTLRTAIHSSGMSSSPNVSIRRIPWFMVTLPLSVFPN